MFWRAARRSGVLKGKCMDSEVVLSVNDGIAVLTLNRPSVLNSLNLNSIKSLLGHLREIAATPSVRALITTGAGRGFCAGWELDETAVPGIEGESLGVRQAHLMYEYFNPVIQAMADLEVPTIAAVNGVAAGAGVSIALAADVIVASDDASFLLTFAPRLGLVPDLGATWKLPRLLGWSRAQAVTLLGERITASQAERWGMAWSVVRGGDLLHEASRLAAQLANGPPGVAREVRRAYEASAVRDLPSQLEYERLRQRELLDRAAFREGVAAFREKRLPAFRRSES